MNVLITGANGFLGRHVVDAFAQRGHRVRAMVRPASKLPALAWGSHVEVVLADLRTSRELRTAFDGIDALVHLAAATSGDDEGQFASSVVGTERLLDAMARSQTRRLVLASSFSVYGFSQVHRRLTEDSPLEERIYERDGYAIAKLWQERVARRMSQQHAWDLTVLRPDSSGAKATSISRASGSNLARRTW